MKMMKIIFLALLLFSGMNSDAQTEGIEFITGLSWQRLKEKAKAENKFIFVDCYATWCGPCKMMDMMVYPNGKVGVAMKDKFLSVKIQFDETGNDSQEIKQWFPVARAMEQEYKIGGYPTFLFFSPQGRLVYKTTGAQRTDSFVKTVNYAMTNPIERVATIMADYKQGKKDYSEMWKVIETLQQLGDNELATVLAKEYKINYLDKLKDTELTREHIKFLIGNYVLLTSKDNFFRLMYNHPAKVDSAWDYPVAENIVNSVVVKEEVEPRLWENDKPVSLYPNWKILESEVKRKYSKLDTKALFAALRLGFYMKAGNWKEYIRLKNQGIKENPPKAMPSADFMERQSTKLNEDAWGVFKLSTDKTALKSALAWSELAIKLAYKENPKEHPLQFLDTKANLLYKLGKVAEAIAQEEQAFELSTNVDKKEGYDQFRKVIDKMKKGEPTWPVKED